MPVHVIIIMLCLIDSVMNAACACLLQLIFICLYKCNEYDGCFDLHNAVDHLQLSDIFSCQKQQPRINTSSSALTQDGNGLL